VERARAVERVARWEAVLGGVESGRLSIGEAGGDVNLRSIFAQSSCTTNDYSTF
jgi:hypothetical protein